MPRGFAITTILVVLLVLANCQAEYSDVSHLAPHKERIDQVCIAQLPIQAHGVTKKVEREKKTDYVLVSEIRFTGPEFTFAEPLQPETSYRILSVQRCTNCLFEEQIRYRISITPSPSRYRDIPTFLRATALSSNAFHCS